MAVIVAEEAVDRFRSTPEWEDDPVPSDVPDDLEADVWPSARREIFRLCRRRYKHRGTSAPDAAHGYLPPGRHREWIDAARERVDEAFPEFGGDPDG